ncbi:hypothetical protein FE257_005468 [Aspergillus nanangensis]|uniref:NodB homology domain-containing protein n=1 Tax=Aspergillus nanangensis TaxID=2582783 RepID=A0AAD4GVJ6_ASPNN|nr:hypothetical protein FE257_005468 [Aspergillus nanangensis]
MLSITLLLTLVQWAFVDQVLAVTIPFGTMITGCTVPDTIALTFDDGPGPYTVELLEILAEFEARATFFLVGNRLNDGNNAEIVELIHSSGHQIASHTQDHPHLPLLDAEEIRQEMFAFEESMEPITGQVPTYMRPPYLGTSADVVDVMNELGYHVVGADIDTKDYENDSPEMIWDSFKMFVAGLDAGGSIVLAHDIKEQTVVSLTRQMLVAIQERGLQDVAA